jgi:hypothetical protein
MMAANMRGPGLGAAFLAQQTEVMDAVQRMRQRARGRLSAIDRATSSSGCTSKSFR